MPGGALPYWGEGKRRVRAWFGGKALGQLVRLGYGISAFTPAAYRRGRLPRPLKGFLILG